jgi:hypothetical protein
VHSIIIVRVGVGWGWVRSDSPCRGGGSKLLEELVCNLSTAVVSKLGVAGRETKTLLGAKRADADTVWSGWQRISVLGQFVLLLEITKASRREKCAWALT